MPVSSVVIFKERVRRSPAGDVPGAPNGPRFGLARAPR